MHSDSADYKSAMGAAGCPDESATVSACDHDELSGQNQHAFSMI